jgi:hypothetical protein
VREKEDAMKGLKATTPLVAAAISLALALAFVLGGCSDGEADEGSETEETAQETSESGTDDADPDSDAPVETAESVEEGDLESNYVGSFQLDEEGAVFPDIVLEADGTGTFTTYSGQTEEGTWAVDEEQYLTLETDAGETVGGVTIIYDDGFEIAYVGRYVRVE